MTHTYKNNFLISLFTMSLMAFVTLQGVLSK